MRELVQQKNKAKREPEIRNVNVKTKLNQFSQQLNRIEKKR